MTIQSFRRLPWHKRLRSLRFWQMIQAIEITNDGIRLERGGNWELASWDEIKNSTMTKQTYMTGTPKFAHSIRMARSEILSFDTPRGRISIDISLSTPHFEHNEDLRNILIKKLHPTIMKHSFVNRMHELFIIVCVILIVAVPLAYYFLR